MAARARVASRQAAYIITDILGDGKFKAMSKEVYNRVLEKNNYDEKTKLDLIAGSETFDISQKTTTQQGIKLTPEIKAKIRGEAMPIKKPSGALPFNN